MKNWSLIQRNTAEERISLNTGLRVWLLCTYSPMVNCFRVVETALSNADSCQSEKLSSTPSYLELGFASIKKMLRSGFSVRQIVKLLWTGLYFDQTTALKGSYWKQIIGVSALWATWFGSCYSQKNNLWFAAKESLMLQWTLSGKQIKVSYNLQYSSHLLKNNCHVTPPPSPRPQCWFTYHLFGMGHFRFPRASVSKRG